MGVLERLPDALPFVERGIDEPEPFFDRAADWAVELTYSEIPKPVRRYAKAQLTSAVAAALWTQGHPVTTKIRATIRPQDDAGDATFLGVTQTTPEKAAYGNAALASALEFDDAILGGPIGRSSVFVSLAFAESHGVSGRDLLTAQVAANEIASRLASAAAIGPLDEERAMYIHAVGAAVGRSMIEGDDTETLADALGTALSQPVSPLDRSLFGSESNVWNASESIKIGIAAVESARSGISGRRDVVEHEDGFLATQCTQPVPRYLCDLGERWHTMSLSVKQFPGSLWVAAPIEAALEVRSRFDRGRTSVRAVDVYVPQTTITDDVRAESYADEQSASLTTTPRSISRNVAAALVNGERKPVRGAQSVDEVQAIADRVVLHHDPKLTVAAVQSNGQCGNTLGTGKLAPMQAALTIGPKATVRHLPTVLFAGRAPTPASSMERAERRFGARVSVTTTDGETIEETVTRPAGFAGAPLAERRAIARTKCRQAMMADGCDTPVARRRTERLLAIDGMETISLADLLRASERE